MSGNGRSVDYRLRSPRLPAGPKLNALANQAESIREILTTKDNPRTVQARVKQESMTDPDTPAADSNQLEAVPQPVRVMVADDHPVVREGLVALITRHPDMCVVAEAENGREAVEKYRALRPDIALIDLRMPDMDGVAAVAAICAEDPNARLVIVTLYESEEEIYRALRAGAQGYILKGAHVDEVIRCIRTVSEGRTWIPPEVGAKLAKRVTDRDLTAREMDVLRTVVLGKSNKEIGVAYNISEGTVKVHMTHILEKLKATGRTEAINVAIKRGLVRIDGQTAA